MEFAHPYLKAIFDAFPDMIRCIITMPILLLSRPAT